MEQYIVKNLLHYRNVKLPGCFVITPKPIAYYDLTFVLEGSITYGVNGTTYVLNKNDAIFIKPGMIRERKQENAPVRYVSFDFEAFDGFDPSLPAYLPDSFTADMKRLIQVFPYSHIPPDPFQKTKIANLLNYILLELLEKNSLRSQNAYVNTILKIVDEKCTEKLTLQSISAQLNLSREYVSYIFRRETGKTLTSYINEQKMLMAKEFVTGSDMPLSEISQLLGFDNYNYFSRLFRRYLDRTPMEMRKMG